MFETILLFIAILGLLVLIHEGGHFVAAKLSGVRVEEFGLGFPPRIFARRRRETEYSLNLLPFGGFVKLAGEDGSPHIDLDNAGQKRLFSFQSFKRKITILLAGVAVNWIFAALLFSLLQISNSPISVSDQENASGSRVTVAAVAQNSPAANAGIAVGDVFIAMRSADNDTGFSPVTINEVQDFIHTHAGNEIFLTLSRNGEEREVMFVPRENLPEGQGALGVSLLRVVSVAYPWYEALWRGAFVALSLSVALVQGLGELLYDFFVQGQVAEGLAGPVGIAALTGDAASLGVFALISFIAILSLNLAILNALPFPALDGGRVVVAILEATTKRSVPTRGLALFHAIGFALLIFLLLAITARDIRHLL